MDEIQDEPNSKIKVEGAGTSESTIPPDQIFEGYEEESKYDPDSLNETHTASPPRHKSQHDFKSPEATHERNNAILEIEDTITDNEAVKFWKRYFEHDYNFNIKE